MHHTQLTATALTHLHDAELYTIVMDREKAELRLGFKDVDGSVHEFMFEKTLAYRIADVRSQNVLSRFMLSGVDFPPGDCLNRVLEWVFSLEAGGLFISADQLQAHFGRIRSGDLVLVYVDPSVGAEIGIVAKVLNSSNRVAADHPPDPGLTPTRPACP